MKKVIVIFISALLLMSGCAPKMKEDQVVKNEKAKKETSIVPSYKLSNENYRMILPYKPSKARGVIVDQLANRMDIDEVEEGLRRHSKEYFDPESYYFQEGQYLDKDTVYNWLGRRLTKNQLDKEASEQASTLKKNGYTVNEEKIRSDLQQGLNPAIADSSSKKQQEAHPRYLSHILEQNFLQKGEDGTTRLQGVSIALAMKSVYRYQTETGGPYKQRKISVKEMEAQGQKIADTVVKRLRKMDGLQNVPILVAIYREEEQESPVPGHFVQKAFAEKGSASLGKWKSIKEEYVLFPSSHANDKYFDDAQVVKGFADEIAKYFPNYVGVIGKGFYINGEMKRLTLEIPLEFNGKGEVLGFSQYAYGAAKEILSGHYDLEIDIKSNSQMESLIYRDADEKDPTVHILH
ncbi:CamS family sex pheromone protein [Virgibacillus sp. 179-BFC.A HS]|uniref:CamS family sex pheromone protein n=1 Tax=Tigheibacillus jepli TaxID=3035914 RepID=A0ABU5CLF9_9BACI|nr:CamS family sex pheromone protein [Virgibacillus sp. 179-BFC.A HS]MDY0406634.1 CamS family sex pheromone protein [Virgibacillus sp. 179-BFC.A HS]